MEEWPLIIFTLLVQGSVGLTLATSLFLLAGGKALAGAEQRRFVLPPLLMAVIAAACGLIASTLHLGYPLNAFHALRHVESSWLSREIIFASLYLAAIGFTTLLVLFFRKVSKTLLLASAVLGLVDIYCMGAIYVHSSVITWTHINTWMMFYGATLSLGATAGLGFFAARRGINDAITQKVALCAAAVLIASALSRVLEQMAYFSYLAKAELSEVVTFPHQPLEAFEQLHSGYLAAWVVLIAGVVIQSLPVRSRGNKTFLVLGALMVIAAEILLRVVFFSLN
ncbi:DmsC/YnfH family molybdoenzyme membrane anchor subunit [Buttiauxella gaviniae]|uniref:DmsC/YnfH family molybdoenzyme membrane anchor subunit n=1 Tax=Buttiauxella gaviniae TaxID=82990 RepID=A0ABV3P0V0_9ENTR